MTMNYENLYKNALERARVWKEKSGMPKNKQGILDDIFPQLKESEDEKIRKDIIKMVTNTCKGEWFIDSSKEECLSWLEKQGEQKPADKAEPKFQNGQWIVWQDKCYKVNYNGCGYELVDQNGLKTSLEYSTVDENAHIFTTQDAKPGDVLYSLDSKQPFIFKHRKPNEQAEAYCGLNIYGKFFVWGTKDCVITTDKYIPSTKEQRDTLEKAMADAGYTFDFDKRELKKIEQKSTWSEEDERICQCLIEDQENTLDEVRNDKYGHSEIISDLKEMYRERIDWLKSLKDRYTWKPSDEQMKALLSEVEAWTKGCPKQVILESLYNDLKKLKG